MENMTKYNLRLSDDPLKKIQKLYPMSNTVIMYVAGFPVTDELADYLVSNPSELCAKLDKDMILRVYAPSGGNPDDKDNDDDDDEYDESDTDFMDDFMSDVPCTSSYDENGIFYTFAKAPMRKTKYGLDIYDLEILDDFEGNVRIFDQQQVEHLNSYINVGSENWIFTYKFKHQVSYDHEICRDDILSDKTLESADKTIYSLMSAISGGMVNLIYSESFKNIINNMSKVAVYDYKEPFIGCIKFNISIPNLADNIRMAYIKWTTDLYNNILEDYVELESKTTPPVVFETGNLYFKQTDFLGQYYYPKGLKNKERRKDINNGGKEEIDCKKRNSKKVNNDNHKEKSGKESP